MMPVLFTLSFIFVLESWSALRFFQNAEASVVTWMSEKELAAHADLVIIGKVGSTIKKPEFNKDFSSLKTGKIKIYHELRIEKIFKQSSTVAQLQLKPKNIIYLRELGYEVKTQKQLFRQKIAGSPAFQNQALILLFLNLLQDAHFKKGVFQVTGLSLGKYDIRKNPETHQLVVQRNLSELEVLPFSQEEHDAILAKLTKEFELKQAVGNLLLDAGLMPWPAFTAQTVLP